MLRDLVVVLRRMAREGPAGLARAGEADARLGYRSLRIALSVCGRPLARCLLGHLGALVPGQVPPLGRCAFRASGASLSHAAGRALPRSSRCGLRSDPFWNASVLPGRSLSCCPSADSVSRPCCLDCFGNSLRDSWPRAAFTGGRECPSLSDRCRALSLTRVAQVHTV